MGVVVGRSERKHRRLKMKVLVAVLALAVAVSARPGGYTSNGGVYNPDKHLDYMDHARNAGAMAQHLARQEQRSGPKIFRSERNQGNAETYVPTFFTSQQNHAALSAARPNAFGSAVRNQRETGFEFESPLYRRPRAA